MNEYRAVFQAAFPKPVDFLTAEYEANQAEIDEIAADEGYRLAGTRLVYTVFTTKQTPHVDKNLKGA